MTTTPHSVPREFVADHTLQRDQRPIVNGPNAFKFAIFGANCSTGQGGLTNADDMIELGNWSEVRNLAQKADRYGIEGFIPIARWRGIGGPDRPWGRQHETFTWAAGLAAATDNIHIFATCHAAFVHPLMAAKMSATVDHISGGRMGLNAVAGYFEPEFKMFGLELLEHDERYKFADEWISLVKRLWADEAEGYEFDFKGDYFTLEAAQAYPKPVQDPGPVVMSAGASPAGQKFAFDHADILFLAVPDADRAASVTPKIRASADEAGRQDLGLWAPIHIICKDTEKEAREYARYVEEQGDLEGALKFLEQVTAGTRSTPWINDAKSAEAVRPFYRAALCPLTGTPEMIVEDLQKLADSGISGACIGMVDYDEGLDRMNEQIMPLMQSAGLRA